jgi:hypothetical protein
MNIRRNVACLVLCAVPTSLSAQEAVFSHRVYSATGRSYQQLWVWSPDHGLTALTISPRDHRLPTCEGRGRSVLFNSEENGLVSTRWRLDRTSGREEKIANQGADFPGPHANPPSAPATCDAGTARLSPDATRVSCAVNGSAILIADVKSHTAIAQIPIDLRYSTGERYPEVPEEYSWAPDSRSLLVGIYGEEGGSTNLDAEDYFVLDLKTKVWTRAFFGTGALWLTPRVVLYVTARDLTPLTPGWKRSVWTAYLTAYDPVTHTSRALTAGLSNDLDPVLCEK